MSMFFADPSLYRNIRGYNERTLLKARRDSVNFFIARYISRERRRAAEKRASSSFDPAIHSSKPGKIGAGYRLVIISKRSPSRSLLGLSAIAMTDKIDRPLCADIYQCSTDNILASSSFLKESIWLLHVTGGSFVLYSVLIMTITASSWIER